VDRVALPPYTLATNLKGCLTFSDRVDRIGDKVDHIGNKVDGVGDSSLQALLSVTSLFSCRAREVTCHYGHVNRFYYLVTYNIDSDKLSYSSCCRFVAKTGDKVDCIGDKVDRISDSRLYRRFVTSFGHSRLCCQCVPGLRENQQLT